jgi:hypothetical protein
MLPPAGCLAPADARSARTLEHDPEKWIPVFGRDHAQTVSYSVMTIRRKVITL